MKVRIKIMDGGKMPKFKRIGDACMDCFSYEKATVEAHSRKLIDLGFALELPEGFEAVVRPRSGLSAKGIEVAIGTIDSNYRGVVKACVINNTNEPYDIMKEDRICQLAIRKTESVIFEVVENLSETERGACGFGSFGT